MRRKILRRAPQSGASRWPPRPPRSTMPRPRINRRVMRMWSGSPRSPTPRLLRPGTAARGNGAAGSTASSGQTVGHSRTHGHHTHGHQRARAPDSAASRAAGQGIPHSPAGVEASMRQLRFQCRSSSNRLRRGPAGGRRSYAWRPGCVRSARSAALTLPETGSHCKPSRPEMLRHLAAKTGLSCLARHLVPQGLAGRAKTLLRQFQPA